MNDKSPVVIHLHIPKTAGSSLNSSLVSSFKKPILAYNDKHKNVDLPNGENYNLVFGHLDYGFHNCLRNDYLYIFLTRRPKERLFSFYKFVSSVKEHPLYEILISKNYCFGQFLQWAMSSKYQGLKDELNNGQIRRVSGFIRLNKDNIRDAFTTACKNALMENSVVGVTDKYAEYLKILSKKGILIDDTELKINKNLRNDKDYNLTESQEALLDDLTKWDDLFYQHCALVFNSYKLK